MKNLLPVAILLTASTLSFGAQVNVTCSAPLQTSVTSGGASSASCTSLSNGSSYAGGGANAAANVLLELALNASDFSSLRTDQTLYAQQAPRQTNAVFGAGAASSTSLAYSKTLNTSGPVRTGYVQIEGYGVGANIYDGGASMKSGLLFDGSATGGYQTELTCYSNSSYCTPGTGYYGSNSLIPVTLGINFLIEAIGGANNSASNFDGSSGGLLRTFYNFRFFEADGVTPVRVSEAPEPATLGLIGLSFSSLLLMRKLRSRS